MPKRFTKEEFIEQAKAVHGDKYDYSQVKYINTVTKVCIICPEHGEFWQRPADHLKGCGCQRCYGNNRLDNKSFIEKAKKVHGNKYDYSKVNITGNNKTKITIVCPKHGEFKQRINDHLSGYGCPHCGNNFRKTTEQFIEEARKVHGDKYDYSKVEYKSAHEKVCIICPEHGEFMQQPSNHLHGANCPYCNCGKKSKMETNIELELEKNKMNFVRQKTFDWLIYKKNLFLDFYLSEYNIAIEVQGEQHFVPIERFGGQEDFILRQKRDAVKNTLCKKHGIKIFYITKKNYSLDEVLKYINETSK